MVSPCFGTATCSVLILLCSRMLQVPGDVEAFGLLSGSIFNGHHVSNLSQLQSKNAFWSSEVLL